MQHYLLFYFFMAIFCLSLPLTIQANQAPEKSAIAIFAGGCFWCMQPPFDKTPGVIKTIVGYTGGTIANPTYKQVSSGDTGHVEAIEVYYDPKEISYKRLLEIFWHNIDPTDADGQFCDRGSPYLSRIFYLDEQQKHLALGSKEVFLKAKRFPKIATQVLPATTFYPAEEYHQKYYQKNPLRYKFYRYRCGRDDKLKRLWGGHDLPHN